MNYAATLFFLAFCALSLFLNGCGTAVTQALVECKLNALKVLPEDPRNATVYDAVDVIERIKACHRAEDGAGGAP